MKKFLILSAGLSVAALASSASAARFYVQPSIAVAEVSGFDSTVGGALAAGFTFSEKHSVEIDVSKFSVDDGYSYPDPAFSGSVEYEFDPLLLSYRYEFPISGKWYGTVGVSAGVTLQKVTSETRISYPLYPTYTSRYERKDESFTVGFQAGVGYRFNDRVAAVLSAKSLRLDDTDVTFSNAVSILQLGLNWRF